MIADVEVEPTVGARQHEVASDDRVAKRHRRDRQEHAGGAERGRGEALRDPRRRRVDGACACASLSHRGAVRRDTHLERRARHEKRRDEQQISAIQRREPEHDPRDEPAPPRGASVVRVFGAHEREREKRHERQIEARLPDLDDVEEEDSVDGAQCDRENRRRAAEETPRHAPDRRQREHVEDGVQRERSRDARPRDGVHGSEHVGIERRLVEDALAGHVTSGDAGRPRVVLAPVHDGMRDEWMLERLPDDEGSQRERCGEERSRSGRRA